MTVNSGKHGTCTVACYTPFIKITIHTI